MPFAMLRWFTPRHFPVKVWVPIDAILFFINLGLGALLYYRNVRVRACGLRLYSPSTLNFQTIISFVMKWRGWSRRRIRGITSLMASDFDLSLVASCTSVGLEFQG